MCVSVFESVCDLLFSFNQLYFTSVLGCCSDVCYCLCGNWVVCCSSVTWRGILARCAGSCVAWKMLHILATKVGSQRWHHLVPFQNPMARYLSRLDSLVHLMARWSPSPRTWNAFRSSSRPTTCQRGNAWVYSSALSGVLHTPSCGTCYLWSLPRKNRWRKRSPPWRPTMSQSLS